ncbi:hypothetical protein EXIGLDRAFT_770406 [Exidia glandulosa HHB12029]|uniref:Uncharacterized protein n=1 Tax=Exidia glandulosa HHB12029 TaxID=1314781 RepID=A0A165GQ20_EXIGL|nr:hypothetical protein EXIGLDRAFT_770406 [Exidia glandulosa HHB12029]
MHDPSYDSDGASTIAEQPQRTMDAGALMDAFVRRREEERQRGTLYGWHESACAFCEGERPMHAWNAEGSRLVQNFVEAAGGSRRFGDMEGLIRGLFQAYPTRLIDAARLKTSDDRRILARDVYVAAWSLESHFPPPDAGGQRVFDWRVDALVIMDALKHMEACEDSGMLRSEAEKRKRKLRELGDLAKHRLRHGQYWDEGVGGLASEYDVLLEKVDRRFVERVWDDLAAASLAGEVTLGGMVREMSVAMDLRSEYR